MALCPCGETKAASQKRCPKCQSVATNYCRVKKEMGAEKALVWNDALNTGKIDKQQFMADAREVMPKDLAKLVDQYLEELFLAEDEVAMVGTGEFLDEDDLKEKYAKKPQRLAAILKNAKRMWCNISECELIEDMKYQSKESSIRKRITMSGIKTEAQEKVKRVKVQEEATAEPASVDGEAKLQDISPAQLTKISKWIEQVDKIVKELAGFVKTIDGATWAEYLPQYVKLKLEAVIVSALASKATLANLTNTKKTAAKISTIAKTIKDLQAEAKEAKRKYLLQMNEAKLAAGIEDEDEAEEVAPGEGGA